MYATNCKATGRKLEFDIEAPVGTYGVTIDITLYHEPGGAYDDVIANITADDAFEVASLLFEAASLAKALGE